MEISINWISITNADNRDETQKVHIFINQSSSISQKINKIKLVQSTIVYLITKNEQLKGKKTERTRNCDECAHLH